MLFIQKCMESEWTLDEIIIQAPLHPFAAHLLK
jgi:hypothetical protein